MNATIMIQGTASGVGKSILATALCRIFTEDGYTVAPFKAQNISSNYYLLEDGQKIARAQAIMACACKIAPNTNMNPVLLMANDENMIEIIIKGKATKVPVNQFNYRDFAEKYFPQVVESFYTLSKGSDIVVIEGAGSPVEMNCNKFDIVNMGLAEAIRSPVLLVSDIVRGGIFASLYGTVMLLTEAQKSLIKGLVVNKFVGDINYFGDGKRIIEELCNTSVVGTVPYIDVNIEDEDNISDFGRCLKTESNIKERNNITSVESYYNYLDGEIDKVAKHFRCHLDMTEIYNILHCEARQTRC